MPASPGERRAPVPMEPQAAPSPARRRALSHVGGEVTLEGDRVAAERLAAAVSVPSSAESEDLARAHVHGFHSYPARMHPLTARRLIETLSRPGEVVLDPFCGSGTVLVEGRLAGRRALGVDANPLAIELAWLKTRGEDATFVEQLKMAAASGHCMSQSLP